jgi:2-polyprenyl-3-methyl-5-hydroxy-6-metoxy-1,4-benzoquinol methylase
MERQARSEAKSTFQNLDVHAAWIRRYRTTENDRFNRLAFDYVAQVFGPPTQEPVVDVGSGSGHKSLLLAHRGYRVRGIDFSHVMVQEANAAANAAGLAERLDFLVGDLTALPFQSGAVSRALCWGVLMHVPDVAKGIAELARVIAPRGILIVSEGNFRSLHALTLRLASRLLGRRGGRFIATPAGLEAWEDTASGRLVTRQADIPWIIAEFERHGLRLRSRRAGQFTEIYTVLPWKPLRWFVHLFNHTWFGYVRRAGPSFGNLLVFDRA